MDKKQYRFFEGKLSDSMIKNLNSCLTEKCLHLKQKQKSKTCNKYFKNKNDNKK
jgi:hypothetical protein